jgi:hypothetical protein
MKDTRSAENAARSVAPESEANAPPRILARAISLSRSFNDGRAKCARSFAGVVLLQPNCRRTKNIFLFGLRPIAVSRIRLALFLSEGTLFSQ